MRRLRVRRPSPAMGVALLALAVALAGTAYAAQQIDGTLIKKGSEPGNRLKDFSVTGRQIDQGSLRHVNAGDVYAAEIPNGCQFQATGPFSTGPFSGGIKASPSGNQCSVAFRQPVGLCAIVVSPLEASQFGSPGAGEVSYRKTGDNTVAVTRRDSSGGVLSPGFFSIAAICPGEP